RRGRVGPLFPPVAVGAVGAPAGPVVRHLRALRRQPHRPSLARSADDGRPPRRRLGTQLSRLLRTAARGRPPVVNTLAFLREDKRSLAGGFLLFLLSCF